MTWNEDRTRSHGPVSTVHDMDSQWEHVKGASFKETPNQESKVSLKQASLRH